VPAVEDLRHKVVKESLEVMEVIQQHQLLKQVVYLQVVMEEVVEVAVEVLVTMEAVEVRVLILVLEALVVDHHITEIHL
jgi:hypothetical protein